MDDPKACNYLLNFSNREPTNKYCIPLQLGPLKYITDATRESTLCARLDRAFTKALACKCEKSHPPAPFQRQNRAPEGENYFGVAAAALPQQQPQTPKKECAPIFVFVGRFLVGASGPVKASNRDRFALPRTGERQLSWRSYIIYAVNKSNTFANSPHKITGRKNYPGCLI
jgi:hypothetical protein